MAKVPPPLHTRWKPGQSGNPGGRPAVPAHLAAIKPLTVNEIHRTIAKYWRMPVGKIRALAATAAKAAKGESIADELNELPAGEAAIMSIFMRAFTTGEVAGICWLMDRTIGKVVDQTPEVDVSPVDDLVKLTTPELLKRAQELLPELKKDSE